MAADGEVTTALRDGALELRAEVSDGNNGVYIGAVRHGERELRCVYKPVSGERPLWDFPDGTLAEREYAAWLVSHALGWGIVPPTVLRDGPAGLGSCQLWVDTLDTAGLIAIPPR